MGIHAGLKGFVFRVLLQELIDIILINHVLQFIAHLVEPDGNPEEFVLMPAQGKPIAQIVLPYLPHAPFQLLKLPVRQAVDRDKGDGNHHRDAQGKQGHQPGGSVKLHQDALGNQIISDRSASGQSSHAFLIRGGSMKGPVPFPEDFSGIFAKDLLIDLIAA